MPYEEYALRGICHTRTLLYAEYALRGIYSTRYFLFVKKTYSEKTRKTCVTCHSNGLPPYPPPRYKIPRVFLTPVKIP